MSAVSEPRSHARPVLLMAGLALGMFGFAFALAPFYSQLCAALGLQTADARVRTLGPPAAAPTVRPVTLRFDTTVNGNLPWSFEPVARRADIETGRMYTATFRVRNLSDRPLVGRAVPSVTPWQAGPYLDKIECFCFNEQPLAPGAEAELSLRYAVLPDLPQQFSALTLSYTFMNTDPDAIARPGGEAEGHVHDSSHPHGTPHEPRQPHAG